jgi:hypothetical protein
MGHCEFDSSSGVKLADDRYKSFGRGGCAGGKHLPVLPELATAQ